MDRVEVFAGCGAEDIPPVERIEPLDVMASLLVTYHGYSLLLTDRSGMISHGMEGFYHRQTRFLSRLRYAICRAGPSVVCAQALNSRASTAYYLAPTPAGSDAGAEPEADDRAGEIVRKGIELQVNRTVGAGFHAGLHVTNHALTPAVIELCWDVDADFADYAEAAAGRRQQEAPVEREWRGGTEGGQLVFSYRHPKLPHVTELRFRGAGVFAYDGVVRCRLELAPQQPVQLAVDLVPIFLGEPIARVRQTKTEATRRCELVMSTPNPAVQAAWDRAAADLVSLALLEGDGPEQRVPAAGIPGYQALFGRDTLVAAFQAAVLDPAMLRGTLSLAAKWQANRYDDRYDEQPGRILHQRQLSPLAILKKNPFLHYYGDYSAPGWFLIDVAWDFFLTGNRDAFLSMRDAVEAVLAWFERDGDADSDGFYEYETKAGHEGEKNQGWKDSNDAILYEDGRLVRDPIALVEIQGAYFAAKQLLAVAFDWAGEAERATELQVEADALKARFNLTFWLPDEKYFALALDPDKKPVATIAADPGQCLAYGIIADEYAAAVAHRLMQPDLFSGWGIRTLSSRHPAFNPFAYHLGSVWPMANAIIASGLKRYGFNDPLHRVARAMFDASGIFKLNRLPEVFGGHQRDADHPHPGIYPNANTPQAWSASAVISLVHTMLGLVPAAPRQALILDPDLPEWLPELTLAGLRVGDARVSLRFRRDRSGHTEHEVIALAGDLRLYRPAPASPGRDRLPDLLRAVARS